MRGKLQKVRSWILYVRFFPSFSVYSIHWAIDTDSCENENISESERGQKKYDTEKKESRNKYISQIEKEQE